MNAYMDAFIYAYHCADRNRAITHRKHRPVQRTATHCNALQRTVTHCLTLQHTATQTGTQRIRIENIGQCNTLRRTATQSNTLQHTATHCNTLQHTATQTGTERMRIEVIGQRLLTGRMAIGVSLLPPPPSPARDEFSCSCSLFVPLSVSSSVSLSLARARACALSLTLSFSFPLSRMLTHSLFFPCSRFLELSVSVAISLLNSLFQQTLSSRGTLSHKFLFSRTLFLFLLCARALTVIFCSVSSIMQYFIYFISCTID